MKGHRRVIIDCLGKAVREYLLPPDTDEYWDAATFLYGERCRDFMTVLGWSYEKCINAITRFRVQFWAWDEAQRRAWFKEHHREFSTPKLGSSGGNSSEV